MKKIISIVVFVVVLFGAIAMVLLFPINKTEPVVIDFSKDSSINAICELATVKSFFHNVAMYDKKPDPVVEVIFWPFSRTIQPGNKQYWLEYSGIVETGIDAGLVQIKGPDENGVVTIYVPDAKILNIYSDESSLTEPLSETGILTTISGTEKNETFAAAQIEMRRQAENNQAILRRAKENAKQFLESYIVNSGRVVGRNLMVQWAESAW